MTDRPAIAFVCAHLCDERLYAAQRAALEASHDCRVFVLRDEDTLAAMAEAVLAAMPPLFTLIGLSLGGYVAFEIVRRALGRVERLALLDTTAVADTPQRRAGRLADIAAVEAGGIEALIPELPGRWLLPAHRQRPICSRSWHRWPGASAPRAEEPAARDACPARFARRSRRGARTDARPVRRRRRGDAVGRSRGHRRARRRRAPRRRSRKRPPDDDRAAEAVSRVLVDWLASSR